MFHATTCRIEEIFMRLVNVPGARSGNRGLILAAWGTVRRFMSE